MEVRSVEAVFRALNEADARYLVAGGLAVVAHGYLRTTQDLDLYVELEQENALRAIRALEALGYRPMVPVAIEKFADPERRRAWAREKDAKVFQLFSDEHRTARVDLFLEAPLEFDRALERARWEEIAPGLEVPFVGLEDLIAMKRAAGRPQDLADVDRLEELRRELGKED
jgi:predicted nucleotidyltransferase